MIFAEFYCVPDDGIISGTGQDQDGQSFLIDGVIDYKRHFKFTKTYTSNNRAHYYEGVMKSDLKVISGHWGPNQDELEDIFRMQLSQSISSTVAQPKVAKEETKVQEQSKISA